MTTVTTTTQTRNALVNDFDTSKFLLGDNNTIDADLTASAGNGVLLQGMVMGRISATRKLLPLDKDAVDGSQFPVGICIVNQTIADAATGTVTLVNKGRIAESKINFFDVETLDTVVGDKTLRDWLNDLGLILKGGQELTAHDNS